MPILTGLQFDPLPSMKWMGFPVAQTVKNLPVIQET